MTTKSKEAQGKISIDLAVYMERLDTYIATQSRLNESLCNRLEQITDDLYEIKEWRTKFYGAKACTALNFPNRFCLLMD